MLVPVRNHTRLWATTMRRTIKFPEVCYLCGLKPCAKGLVREHCHWTGAYKGAACHSCNAKLVFKSIPVYFHNMADFDHVPLIRAIAEMSSPYPRYTAIPH